MNNYPYISFEVASLYSKHLSYSKGDKVTLFPGNTLFLSTIDFSKLSGSNPNKSHIC